VLKRLYTWQKQSDLRIVAILAGIFFTLTLILALNRHYSFYSTNDHGLFNQLFWNSIHGRLFQSSLSSGNSSASLIDGQPPSVSYYHLGQHFVPDFLLWMPIYALFPSATTLVVLQVALIAAGGLVLYALARHYLSPSLSIAIAASYYGANAVIGPTVDNFYEQCQLPLFVFGLLLALEKRLWWLFWLLVALTLGIREDTGIILFGIGVYLVLSRRYPRVGLALCTLSFSYVVIVTNLIVPLFSNDNSRLYLGKYFSKFVKSENPSTLELLWAIATQPGVIIEVLLTRFDQRVRYLLGQWLPLAFVPVISFPAWAIAAFPLLELLVQNNVDAVSINTRYTLSVVPGLFYGAILWWHSNSEKFKPRFRRFWIACIALSLFFTITSNPHKSLYFLVPYSIKPWNYVSLNHQWEHAAHLRTVMKSIPDDASVATGGYVIPHLSSRREIVRLPFIQLQNDEGKIVDVDYALVDMWQLQQSKLAAGVDWRKIKASVPIIDQALEQEKYGIIDLQDGVMLLKKGVPSNSQAKSAWLKLREELRPIWQA
jgi:uncharacterized membrane protein